MTHRDPTIAPCLRPSRAVVVAAAASAVVMCASPAIAAVKHVFVTSATGTGNLSTWPAAEGNTGLAAGDHICRKLAMDATPPLANANTYRAWLSTSTVDAFCHVAGSDGTKATNCGLGALPNAGPWALLDETAFSRRLQALTTQHVVLHPVVLDENDTPVTPEYVHTGTEQDGTVSIVSALPETCNDWTNGVSGQGVQGRTSQGTLGWTEAANGSICNRAAHLLCFEPGTGDDIPSADEAGALVFVTSVMGSGNLGSWPDSNSAHGLAAGDTICRNRARKAFLPFPASFTAWLSGDGIDAIDRITTDGPFRRIGGTEIAASRADLLSADAAHNALASDVETNEFGSPSASFVFTGTSSQGIATSDVCGTWQSASLSDHGTVGEANDSSGAWTQRTTVQPCAASFPIYCVQNVVTIFWNGFESGNTNGWSSTSP